MKQTHVQYKEHVQETEYIDLNGITFLVALHSWALLFNISTTYSFSYLSQYVDFLSIFFRLLSWDAGPFSCSRNQQLAAAAPSTLYVYVNI